MPARPHPSPDLTHEAALLALGHRSIAGVDEAGRGPLAGPVVAAAVILPEGFKLAGLDDSKRVSPLRRASLAAALSSDPAVSLALGTATVAEIDSLNILQATHLAMRRAILALPSPPDIALIDGRPVPGLTIPHSALVKGDQLSLSIAAASILAKTHRDAIMAGIHVEFPLYGFSQHHGYGTRQHLEALEALGPCPHHRRSFAPVARLSPRQAHREGPP